MESLEDTRENPSIYVGETARSVKERALEHWADYASGNSDSHIRKHWELHHQGQGEPQFRITVVGQFRDALSRQVAEAIRIMMRGSTLNSKNGYNRCSITRLVIDKQDTQTQHEDEDNSVEQAALDRMGKKRVAKDRVTREQYKDQMRNINNISKRNHEETVTFGTATQSKKKRKYTVLGKEWGNGCGENSTRRLEKESFLKDPVFITQKEGKLRQTAINIKIWSEEELWMRRTVIWDLIGGVVETVETSRQVIEELLSTDEKEESC